MTELVNPYDSTLDTLAHIDSVRRKIELVCALLTMRAALHDASKLEEPEKSAFDQATPKLKYISYGSDEYKAALAELGEALHHHYAVNRHHPQHFENGINGMTLIDVVEMFCDWAAACERHNDGNLQRSIELNIERLKLSPQLAAIFENTQRALLW